MIKLIIFDNDGVIADLKEVHYQSLNSALATIDSKYLISREEHISTYDGLSTKKKLSLLSKDKNFPTDLTQQVFDLKQKFTIEATNNCLSPNPNIILTLSTLKQQGYKIYMASNAIREVILLSLKKLNVLEFFDKIYSNEDVIQQKPSPEIYFRCMIDAQVKPSETLIVEDSKHGREAALESGAHLCDVDQVSDTTLERLNNSIQAARYKVQPWYAKNSLNIVIPMAGSGSRFTQAGYKVPKPLISINNKPMIQVVVENLNIKANFFYIVQKSHYENYNLQTILNLISPNCTIIQVDGLTEGAACTILKAKEFIDNDKHLLTLNSDQFIEWNSADFMYKMLSSKADGGIMTFEKHNDPKWSYVRTENSFVTEVAEKNPISTQATVGYYYWDKGSDFVKYAEQMISNNDRVNNEFYAAPAYNYAIRDGKKIITKDISKMWGLGVPEDLDSFVKNYKGEL